MALASNIRETKHHKQCTHNSCMGKRDNSFTIETYLHISIYVLLVFSLMTRICCKNLSLPNLFSLHSKSILVEYVRIFEHIPRDQLGLEMYKRITWLNYGSLRHFNPIYRALGIEMRLLDAISYPRTTDQWIFYYLFFIFFWGGATYCSKCSWWNEYSSIFPLFGGWYHPNLPNLWKVSLISWPKVHKFGWTITYHPYLSSFIQSFGCKWLLLSWENRGPLSLSLK